MREEEEEEEERKKERKKEEEEEEEKRTDRIGSPSRLHARELKDIRVRGNPSLRQTSIHHEMCH